VEPCLTGLSGNFRRGPWLKGWKSSWTLFNTSHKVCENIPFFVRNFSVSSKPCLHILKCWINGFERIKIKFFDLFHKFINVDFPYLEQISGAGGNRIVNILYKFWVVTWIEVPAKLMPKKLAESRSVGHMSLSPLNGETEIVDSSYWGWLLEMPPSRYCSPR
jgi:hypothetical protein